VPKPGAIDVGAREDGERGSVVTFVVDLLRLPPNCDPTTTTRDDDRELRKDRQLHVYYIPTLMAQFGLDLVWGEGVGLSSGTAGCCRRATTPKT
jgi:hypothetical protein